MIGIVVLNYNTWNDSIKCVESIITVTTVPYRIYIVDNCSLVNPSLEQLNWLCNNNVKIIFNEGNFGYAVGNNIGLKCAYNDGCTSFIVSNSDVILKDDCIDKMIKYAENNPKVGIVAPVIYNREGCLQPIYMLSKLTALGKIKNMMLSTPLRSLFRSFKESFVMDKVPSRPLKVFGVSGCFFLITKDCYNRVFPFDENTFLYEEEYILGCKLERENIEAHILPTAKVIHAEAVSTGGISDFSYKCLIDSEQYYLKEYMHENFFMRLIIRLLRKLIFKLVWKK